MGTVLLTGASGFLGGAVLERLTRRSHRVITLGRTVPRSARPASHLAADLGEPATILRHREALRQVELAAHLGGHVLHAAAPASDDPVQAARVNVAGTARLLAALPPSLRGFCFASTLDVYGPPRSCPVREDHPPAPATHYAASKLAAETLLEVWSGRHGVPLAVLRLTHVYGPGDPSAKAVPSFLRACLRGERPRVRGDGSDVRDYVYVEDAADAVVRALELRAAGTFNIASGAGISIRQLLAAVRLATGSSVEPAWLPAVRPASRVILDPGRARVALGWEPRIGLAEGLRRTVAALTAEAPSPPPSS
jgi:nucleoside-diphosphate-sugar epimerase